MSGVPLLAIAYVSLLVFIAASVFRTLRLARMPVHLRWELSPVPHEKGRVRYGGSYLEEYEWWTKPRERSVVSEMSYMLQEILFLKAVWENNRRLWRFSFPFHFGIYLLVVAGAILFLGAVLQLVEAPSFGAAGLRVAVLAFAAAGYGLGAVGAIGLLVSRLTDPRLKLFGTGATVFNLAFLAAVFLSGGYALIAFGGDYAKELTGFLGSLLTADAAIQMPVGLAAHLVLVFLFLAYLPFTKMLHFVAKYFTYHQVRWDDEPMTPGSRMERKVLKLLQQPVTWSAPHLHADGRKNWVDIATEEEEVEK